MERERRRSERINSLVAVRYASESGEIKGNSFTEDISESGIGFPIDGRIPRGTKLDLAIMLEKEPKKEIHAVATVIWSRRNTQHWKSRYTAGVKFFDIDREDKDRLLEYARVNRWIKSDFERSLEENKVPILGGRGEFLI